MMDSKHLQISKDLASKKVTVTRQFEASPDLVWKAWTEADLLDQWWAPKPWRAETKEMNFTVGGHWLYAMVGPDNTRHWARVDFKQITPGKNYEAVDSFCDENGKPNKDLPGMIWKNEFLPTPTGTKVVIELLFANEAELQKLMEMGFQEGFTAALENLDHYLGTQFRLRKEGKTGNAPRVTTYLNFPGKTEEAFLYYKQVFKGEFTGIGLQRFGDIPAPADAPPMSEEDKKLIIHAELTILGGHVLMATDAPESMGFKLQQGNNMHINVEPSSREETKRLFDGLAEGGSVTMPLADMFWGAYFGSLTDRYGINWMFNCQGE
jgi:PhnB protein